MRRWRDIVIIIIIIHHSFVPPFDPPVVRRLRSSSIVITPRQAVPHPQESLPLQDGLIVPLEECFSDILENGIMLG